MIRWRISTPLWSVPQPSPLKFVKSANENEARAKPTCTFMLLPYQTEMKEPSLAAGIKRDDRNVFSI